MCFIGVQTTHGKKAKSSHKPVFGPVKMSPGELLQQQCKYENHNFRARTVWFATFDEVAFFMKKV